MKQARWMDGLRVMKKLAEAEEDELATWCLTVTGEATAKQISPVRACQAFRKAG
jgi:hypothetical protein